MESKQVQLRLIDKNFSFENEHGEIIKGDKILDQMKKNQVWKNDKEGKYVPVLFDGQAFCFREGKIIQVGERIARALQRSANIIVGPKAINGPSCPFLEVVKEFAYTVTGQEAPRPQFACPICDKDCERPNKLTRHMMKDHPKEVNEPVVDWEGTQEKVAAGVEEED